MRSKVPLVLVPLALAGCPPPAHYLIADVSAGHAPVADAMVAADCRRSAGPDAAMRTDDSGRVRLAVRGPVDAGRCTVTVAKPGFRTVETEAVNLCTTTACPPMAIHLLPPYAPYDAPIVPIMPGRGFATPPRGGLR